MPYNKNIDVRIRNIVGQWENVESKKMFGGVCYLADGSMFCGVYRDSLILRLGEEEARKTIESGRGRPFDITGRPMKGWVMMEEESFPTEEELNLRLTTALEFTKTNPPKKKGKEK